MSRKEGERKLQERIAALEQNLHDIWLLLDQKILVRNIVDDGDFHVYMTQATKLVRVLNETAKLLELDEG